jgi:IMP-specific 5'-nucleotidase
MLWLRNLSRQGLLAVPFVLLSQPTAVFENPRKSTTDMALGASRRYLEIMRDVEELINDHSRAVTSWIVENSD